MRRLVLSALVACGVFQMIDMQLAPVSGADATAAHEWLADAGAPRDAKPQAPPPNAKSPYWGTYRFGGTRPAGVLGNPADSRVAQGTKPEGPAGNAAGVGLQANASDRKIVSTLVGRSGRGTIGQLRATIEFRQNTFVVGGDIEGKGTWEQSGPGIVLRTESSVYRGTIAGDAISGRRFSANAPRQGEPWQFVLNQTTARPSAGQPASTAARSLAGRKGSGTIGQFRATIEFRDEIFIVGGEIAGEGTWELSGPRLVLETSTSVYRGTINGDTISGTRFNPADERQTQPWRFVLEPRPTPVPKMQVSSPTTPPASSRRPTSASTSGSTTAPTIVQRHSPPTPASTEKSNPTRTIILRPMPPSAPPSVSKNVSTPKAVISGRKGIAGRKGIGRIGDLVAAIEFRDRTFVVSGAIEGEGTWQQSDESLILRTESSVYRGKIDGNAIFGTRVTAAGNNESQRWRFVLDPRPEPPPTTRPLSPTALRPRPVPMTVVRQPSTASSSIPMAATSAAKAVPPPKTSPPAPPTPAPKIVQRPSPPPPTAKVAATTTSTSPAPQIAAPTPSPTIAPKPSPSRAVASTSPPPRTSIPAQRVTTMRPVQQPAKTPPPQAPAKTPASSLVGTKWDSIDTNFTLEFEADGRAVIQNPRPLYPSLYSWTLKGSKVILTYKGFIGERGPVLSESPAQPHEYTVEGKRLLSDGKLQFERR